jgi:hypothetical protein
MVLKCVYEVVVFLTCGEFCIWVVGKVPALARYVL